MYPFRDENVYVKNCWYVAALRSEVNRQPFERTICDEPIVFYRTEAGTAVALHGLCPHRYYPLARGKLVGDAIECGYHGFTFDCHGKCTKVPSLGDKGLNFSQRAFPVVEHGPWVWIWPGDASRADPLALPNLAVLGCDVSGSHLKDWHVHAEDPKPFAARAQLIIDNLMDLTHIAFLHSSLIDCSHLLRAPIQIEQLGETGLRIRRSVENGSWDGFCEVMFTGATRFDKADYHSETCFFGPGFITTSGYEFRTDEDAFIAMNSAYTSSVVDQDIEAVNAMEPRIEKAAQSQRELLAKSDLATARVRKLLQEMIDRENNEAPLRTERFSQ